MHPVQPSPPSAKQFARILVVHPKRWLVPTLVVGLLAAAYAVVRPPTWEASQALIVRNEAANNQQGPGKFNHTDEMKTVQETILEVAKSRGVLGAALRAVGPPTTNKTNQGAWPAGRDVVQLREAVKLVPPKGAEFGKTEVFYLHVGDHDRDRALALNLAICDRLQARFQELRDAKAQSMIEELVKTVDLARADLEESTRRLTATEAEVGSDLAELRILHDATSGDSALRRTITEIRNELRQIRATGQASRQLLALLREAQEDPGKLVATPNRLLQSQPALRRLKEGLIDAQIRTAGLKGTMSDEHPLVRSAKHSEKEIRRDLYDELAIAVRGLQLELQLNTDREAMLQRQLAKALDRLSRLASLRATYSNQVAETRHRAGLLEKAERNLAEARAAHAGAKASSLMGRIDAPDAGIQPVGPSRAGIVLIGIAGGLLTGFGVLVLTVQSPRASSQIGVPGNGAQRRSRAPFPGDSPRSTPATSLKQALDKIEYGSRA